MADRVITAAASSSWRAHHGHRLGPDRRGEPVACAIAEEVPIAIAYGGVPHAVMMATPADLEDFAIGFSLTEGVIAAARDIRDITLHKRDDGVEIALALAPEPFRRFLQDRRLRNLRGHTSCGLCGVAALADVAGSDAMRRAADAGTLRIGAAVIAAALDALREFQPLSRLTHAAHAAAWSDASGRILFAREDVGRHNALDKLIGACLRGGAETEAGFGVVTSRCSFEMVQKAVAARMPMLVSISAPTALAIRQAEAAGLTIVTCNGPGEAIVHAGRHRIA